jgi:glutamate racemase
MKIGFFDSGLGGLTVLRAVAKELPQYDYVYYGDTANLPYGDKTEEEIYRLTTIGMEYLFEAGCLLVIIACNTASAETARRLQQEFIPQRYPDRKILGIIIPTIEVLDFSTHTKVTLIGTKRTVESAKYVRELESRKNDKVIFNQIATPELVPLIELGEIETALAAAIARIEREAGESDVVVLGCTHYTQIKEGLRAHFTDQKCIISQDEVIPDKLKNYLANHPELAEKLTSEGVRSVHLTKHRPDYDLLMGQFLGGAYIDEG